MDSTRAAEITRNVRSLLVKSVTRPINLSATDNIYAFYYPESSLTFRYDEHVQEYERGSTRERPSAVAIGGTPQNNTVFFRLPSVIFDATQYAAVANNPRGNAMLTRLPNDALDLNGSARSFPEGPPQVFRLLPDNLRRVGAVDGLDMDDRMNYQFSFQIRRSVARAATTNERGEHLSLEDLFVVDVKIFKQYILSRDEIRDPFYEWSFFVAAAK
jgi:hypothetical protein